VLRAADLHRVASGALFANDGDGLTARRRFSSASDDVFAGAWQPVAVSGIASAGSVDESAFGNSTGTESDAGREQRRRNQEARRQRDAAREAQPTSDWRTRGEPKRRQREEGDDASGGAERPAAKSAHIAADGDAATGSDSANDDDGGAAANARGDGGAFDLL
jgi:hypothetical protein